MPTPEQLVFIITAAVIIASAVQVVSTNNLVHAALWLIVTLFGMAIIFVLLNAGFLAVVQVVVYIGAISILIIFAIMLTRRVMQDTGTQINAYWPVSLAIAALLFLGLWQLVFSRASFPVSSAAVPDGETVLRTLGTSLATPDFYMLPLVVVGVLLAAGMIGSIAIARDEDKE
jgi:NADH-quinone oxidoreductase subunit J